METKPKRTREENAKLQREMNARLDAEGFPPMRNKPFSYLTYSSNNFGKSTKNDTKKAGK